jgi:hypothetical protein
MLLSLLRRRSTRTLLTVAFGLSLATPALSETLYRWKTDDGYGYADDLKRVPERYRAKAETIVTGSLSTYSRYTPTDPEADKTHQARVTERLEHLRRLNAGLDRKEAYYAATAAPGQKVPFVRVGPDDGAPIYVPTGGADADAGPIVVEEKRYRVAGSFVTRHDTIVRQGDRIIAIYKPRPHVVGTTSTLDIQDESVLEKR